MSFKTHQNGRIQKKFAVSVAAFLAFFSISTVVFSQPLPSIPRGDYTGLSFPFDAQEARQEKNDLLIIGNFSVCNKVANEISAKRLTINKRQGKHGNIGDLLRYCKEENNQIRVHEYYPPPLPIKFQAPV